MSDKMTYVMSDEYEKRVGYALSALEGIVIAAVITGNQSFQEPANIATAAFEIADAMIEKEETYASKAREQ